MFFRIIKKLLILATMTSALAANIVFANQDPYHELKNSLSKAMRRELEPVVDQYLKNVGINPDESRLYRTRVNVRLGHEREMDSVDRTASFLSEVNVKIQFEFVPPTADFDRQIHLLLKKWLNKRGMRTRQYFSSSKKPFASIVVTYNQSLQSFEEELRRNLVFVSFALLALLVIYCINLLGMPRQRIRSVERSEKSKNIPNVYSEPEALNRQSPRIRKHPTKSMEDFQKRYQYCSVNPVAGTWYLHAIPEVPTKNLEKAFQTISFDEAIVLLKSFNKNYRREVMRRLDLMPAIRERLEKEVL